MSRRDPKRLRRLLHLRRRQEETARRQLADSLRRAAEISDEVRVRTDALESALAGRRTPEQRRHLDVIVEIATPAILAAQAAEASALGAVAELRREWNKSAIRLKGMERLEERAREAELERIAEDEMRRIDDALMGRLRGDTP